MRKIVQITLFFLFCNLRPQEAGIENDKIVFSFRSSDGVVIPVKASIADQIETFKSVLEVILLDGNESSGKLLDFPMVSKKSWDTILLIIASKNEIIRKIIDFDCWLAIRPIDFEIFKIINSKIKNIDPIELIQLASALDFLNISIILEREYGKKEKYLFYDCILKTLSLKIQEFSFSKALNLLSTIENPTLLESLKDLFLNDFFKHKDRFFISNEYVKAHNLFNEPLVEKLEVIDYLPGSDNQKWVEYVVNTSTVLFNNSLNEEVYFCTLSPDVRLGAVFYYKENMFFYINLANEKVSLNKVVIDEKGIVLRKELCFEHNGVMNSYSGCNEQGFYAFSIRRENDILVQHYDVETGLKKKIKSFNDNGLLIIFNKLVNKVLFCRKDGRGLIVSLENPKEKKTIYLEITNIRTISFSEDDKNLAISTGENSGELVFFNIENSRLIGSAFPIGDNVVSDKIIFNDHYCKAFLSDGSVQYYLTPQFIKQTLKKSFTVKDAFFINFAENEKKIHLQRLGKQYFHFYMFDEGKNVCSIYSPIEDHTVALEHYREEHSLKKDKEINEERLALFGKLKTKRFNHFKSESESESESLRVTLNQFPPHNEFLIGKEISKRIEGFPSKS